MAKFINAQLSNLYFPPMTVNLNQTDCVGISLVTTDMQSTTRISDYRRAMSGYRVDVIIFFMSDCLRFMDMSQGEIVITITHCRRVECPQCADVEMMTCWVKTCHSLVSHHDNR